VLTPRVLAIFDQLEERIELYTVAVEDFFKTLEPYLAMQSRISIATLSTIYEKHEIQY